MEAGTPPPTTLGGDASLQRADVDLGASFAVLGLNPSHGPFTGGTRTVMSGRGFSSNLQVLIGGVHLATSDVVASEPTQAAIITPPGAPGPADVTIQDTATAQQATLPAGFFYDSFVLQPQSGATSGGTRIAITGSGTSWIAGTAVQIAGVPCASVAVVDSTHMQCATPPGAPGTVDVDVITPDMTDTKARDAYTYSDSPDGYRGGLAGGALNGTLTVLAFDSAVGTPIVGAHTIAGEVIATAIVGTTDATGTAVLNDPSLTGTVTVTVAAKCHQPVTFVDVPVDTVTVYLDPVLAPTCGTGDPPSEGNYGTTNGGEISGELVWSSGQEFQRGAWNNVPSPQNAAERMAAYVFTATTSPSTTFSLPAADAAITPSTPGSQGYQYSIVTYPGNLNIYALAGIENRSLMPPVFTAYAMGVARGISLQPSTNVTGVDIPMDIVFDNAVTLTPEPPAPAPQGPDRLVSQLAVTLDETTYAVLPSGQQVTFLPVGGNVSFVGVPALDNALASQSYVVSGSAVTGSSFGMPESVVSFLNTTNVDTPITLGGFLGVPIPGVPAQGTWSGTQVSFGAPSSFDLAMLTVSSGNNLVTWTIVAPTGDTAFNLPDLSGFPDSVGLVHGAIETTVYVANINSFQYGQVVYGQLSTSAWNAYAAASASGVY
jgi:hypothetical protein